MLLLRMNGTSNGAKEARIRARSLIGLLPLYVAASLGFAPKSFAQNVKPNDSLSPVEKSEILAGAGDIAGCDSLEGAEATARLLDKIPGTIIAVGDLAYGKATEKDFELCYGKTWGRHKNRTRPVPGNHEYTAKDAAEYFRYWGRAAGRAGKGYYSFELGDWHIVALNSNCEQPELGGCSLGSPQEKWLREDLKKHRTSCTLAYWHHPLFSSGLSPWHAMRPAMKTLWMDLQSAHADVIVTGHEHSYERFAPQDADGKRDIEHGIREFVVGTGGRSHTPLGRALANSEVRDTETYGVLKLTLYPRAYKWEFIPEAGKTFRDSGSGNCH